MAWTGGDERGHLRQVDGVVEAVEAGVGSAGRSVEQGAVATGASVRGRAVVVAVGGEKQASRGQSAVSEDRSEAVEHGHGESRRDLINSALVVGAAVLCGAIEISIRCLDERADGEGSAGTAGETVGIVDHAGGGHLQDRSTVRGAALGDGDVEISVGALGWSGDGRIAVGEADVELIDLGEGARTGDLVDDAA